MKDYRRRLNELLLKVKNGDTHQMESVYNLTYNHLKFVALHYVYHKRDYEDALSETYFRALKYIQSFNIFKDGYGWLCRIVKNVAFDINREYKHYVLYDDYTDDFTFSDEIDALLQKDEMYQYVKTLPKLERQLVYYRFYLDLTYDKIAKKINRSKAYVYDHLEKLTEKIIKKFTCN